MTDERAMRFGYLLSEIEVQARQILDGAIDDIPTKLLSMMLKLDEAQQIAFAASREALDKVTMVDGD